MAGKRHALTAALCIHTAGSTYAHKYNCQLVREPNISRSTFIEHMWQPLALTSGRPDGRQGF